MSITNYYWDVDTDNVFLEEDEDGNAIAEYTQEPGLYGELIAQERDGQASYYNFDGQGSTRELTDLNQIVTDEYTYSAFGETVAGLGTSSNPFRYKGAMGYYASNVANDVYVRRRTYTAPAARWCSRDPLFSQDVANLYVYVHNQPIDNIDPSGMLTIDSSPSEAADRNCGGSFWLLVDYKFTARIPDPKKRFGFLPMPPCDGYFVQKMDNWCFTAKCKEVWRCDLLQHANSPTTIWEALPAKMGQGGLFPDLDVIGGSYPRGTCGHMFQRAEVRFYCMWPQAFTQTHTGLLEGQFPTWRDPRTEFPGEGCRAKFSLSTKHEPPFWRQRPLDGPAYREFRVSHRCCCQPPEFVRIDYAPPPIR